MNNAQARVIDPILSQVAQGYVHPQRVGSALFPTVNIPQRGGKVIQFGRESFKRYNTRRAPGSSTKRVQVGYEGQPVKLHQDSLEGLVPWEHMQEASQVPGIELGTEAVNEVMDIISLGLEIEQAGIATDPDNFEADHKETLSGTDQWSDDGSSPATQIADYRETVRGAIGLRPNVLVIPGPAFSRVQHHPKVLERFKYTSSDSVTAEMLARLFNLDRVVVGEAVYMDEGDESMQDVWGNSAVLAYVPQTVTSRRAPSFGYTYQLQGHPLVEEPYSERNVKSWLYPVTHERSAELTGMHAGFLIQDLLAG